MAFTAYCQLAASNISQQSPAQFTSTVAYSVVDTVANAAVQLHDGRFGTTVDVILSPPITQNSVLSALQTAVQNAEPGTPGLTFVWLKL